jgi:hypothetical protein
MLQNVNMPEILTDDIDALAASRRVGQMTNDKNNCKAPVLLYVKADALLIYGYFL